MTREHKAVLNLERETQAAEALRAALVALPDMNESRDADILRDTIEGELSLRLMIDGVLALLTEAEVMLGGLDEKITEFEARKRRFTDRKNFLRSMIEQAMVVGEIETLYLPDATLSLSRRAGGVVIVDESRIPSEFWRQPDPQVDKKKLGEVLKEGATVPGATLGNGSVSLTVRRS